MKDMKAKKRIIFALDLPTLSEATGFVRELKDSVGLFKIGLELFVSEGPGAVSAVREEAPGCGIFLDLKFHDIPATVGRAVTSATALGADMMTIHAQGDEMMRQAAKASGEIKVLGVTVLTSLGADDLADAGFLPKLTEPAELVLHRARMAKDAGLSGLVCSPKEVRAVREELGADITLVTPGVRLAEGDDDQKRTATPYQAVLDGADYVVVGRPIRDAKDPRAAAGEIEADIERALMERYPVK